MGNDVYSWRCDDDQGEHVIDVQDACHELTGEIDAFADYGDSTDSTSWRCYLPPVDDRSLNALGGIDLQAQCSTQYPSGTAHANGPSPYDWACSEGSQVSLPIDFASACQTQYNSKRAQARVGSDFGRASWKCYSVVVLPGHSGAYVAPQGPAGAVDVQGYCTHLFGASATAANIGNTPYGWVCDVGSEQVPVDIQDACRRGTNDRPANRAAFAGYLDFAPRSWRCYLPQ